MVVPKITIRHDAKRLERRFREAPDLLRAGVLAGLRRGSNLIVKRAQQNLTKNRSVAFGMLRASIGYQITGERSRIGPGLAARAGRSPGEDPANYGFYVEFGRSAGGRPPADAIDLWIRRKLKADPEERLSGGRKLRDAILDKIAQRGTEARPFLEPALRESERAVLKVFDEEIQRALLELDERGP